MKKCFPLIFAAFACVLPLSAQNLLLNNPSFDSASGSFFNGGYTINGWSGNNPRFASHSAVTSALYPGTGTKAWQMRFGGTLTTATADRADVVGGRSYLFSFLAKKTVDEIPGQRIGVTGYVYFYDSTGAQIKQVYTEKAHPIGVQDWKVFRLLAAAPPTAVKAGVRLTFSTGSFPNEDKQTFQVDDVQLTEWTETDSLGFRSVPMAITGGQNVTANVKYRLSTARDILVRLNESGNMVAESRVSVMQRRGGAVAVPVTVPAAAIASENYQWQARIVPTGGAWGDGVATATQGGVFLDDTLMTGNQITLDNPHIHLDGRWSGTGTSRSSYWLGTQAMVRFTGTSLGMRYSFSSSDSSEKLAVRVSVDGADAVQRTFNQGTNSVVNLVSGLAPGIHTASIIRDGPEARTYTLSRIDLDAGAGLLRHQPTMPGRRVHAYGDSTASGSSGGMYVNYTTTTARTLGSSFSVVGKGGTGVSGGFTFENNGLYYWDRASFNAFYDPTPNESDYPRNPYTFMPEIDTAQARGAAYGPGNFAAYGDPADWSEITNKGNFANDVPNVVLIGWGQNDQFGNGPFSGNYRQFIILQKKLFPNARFICTHTHMTSPNYIEGGVYGITQERHIGGLNEDGRIHFLPHVGLASAAGSGGHPSGAQNQELALGSAVTLGIVDLVEDVIGWSGTAPGDPFSFGEPVMSPPPTRYDGPQTVTLTTLEPGASFRYTTDGTWPTPTSGTEYTGPFLISATTTIKAIAYGPGLLESPIATKSYTIAAATPVAAPAAGTFDTAQTITLSTTTPDAEIRYTLDGSTPTASSTLYTGPFSLSTTTTIQALAIKAGIGNSAVLTAAYTIRVAMPTATPAAGTYSTAQSVTLATTTAGATIRYTTDGSTPSDVTGTVYLGPINVATTQTIRAIAYNGLVASSAVLTAAYTINANAAAPTFDPPAGDITGITPITLATTTVGASIRYTLDGTDPSAAAGTLYSAPFEINTTTTVKAIAFTSGLGNSPIASATYTATTPAAAAPTATPNGGNFLAAQSVALSTATSGASIRFTLDGTPPSETDGTLYTAPFTLTTTTTVKAIAFKAGFANSVVTTVNFARQCDAPVITPVGGIHAAPLIVGMTTATQDGEIRFTTDGSTPTAASTLYSSPIALSASATLRAITRFGDFADSNVTTAALTVYANLAGWRTAYGLPADGTGDLATPAADGTPNLLKYAFAIDPIDESAFELDPNGAAGLPRIDLESPSALFSYVRRKSSTGPGITYTPLQSPDLDAWTPILDPPVQTVDLDAIWERVTFALPLAPGKTFARVRIEIPLPTNGTLTSLAAADGSVNNTTLTNMDGGGTSVSTTSGTVAIGNSTSTLTTMRCAVYVFQLPNLGARPNPFASATFTCTLTNNGNTFGNFNVDLYGLGARAASPITTGDYYTGTDDTTDAAMIVNNFVSWPNSSTRPATGEKTTSAAALVNYLNAQYAGGAGIGHYVFLRLSSDKIPANLKGGTFAMTEDGSADPKIDFVTAP